jgi:hypothetical protein
MVVTLLMAVTLLTADTLLMAVTLLTALMIAHRWHGATRRPGNRVLPRIAPCLVPADGARVTSRTPGSTGECLLRCLSIRGV